MSHTDFLPFVVSFLLVSLSTNSFAALPSGSLYGVKPDSTVATDDAVQNEEVSESILALSRGPKPRGSANTRRFLYEASPPPPYGPQGIHNFSDILDKVVLIDEEPDTLAYLAEASRVRAQTMYNRGDVASSGPRFCLSSRESAYKDSTDEPPNDAVNIFFQGEFGYELMVVLPFAYYHFLQGTLGRTKSCGDSSTALLYWFSERHEHVEGCARDDYKNQVAPYGWTGGLHKSRIPPQWYPPPLAAHFREWGKLWKIPPHSKLIIISNKLSNEWFKGPINIIDIPTLKQTIQSYIEADFYVIYNRAGNAVPEDKWQLADNPGFRLDDYKVIRKLRLQEPYRSRLRLVQDIAEEYPDLSFNEVQFRLMARSKCFISVQGGNSIVSSYFGGTNIIFARRGFELDFKAYYKTYYRLAGTSVVVARNFYRLGRHVNTMIHNSKCESI
eukprot:TRINITY_DN1095_c0_g1_i1.p1 TRINITY_DN1095_c0_g1~~TRINITY_DN1095_c0_g1_i1.p1  ORF type:complete len:443 (-),score=38.72 TRINITY_DN1095_c0_g1_i1:138-1466(-)